MKFVFKFLEKYFYNFYNQIHELIKKNSNKCILYVKNIFKQVNIIMITYDRYNKNFNLKSLYQYNQLEPIPARRGSKKRDFEKKNYNKKKRYVQSQD